VAVIGRSYLEWGTVKDPAEFSDTMGLTPMPRASSMSRGTRSISHVLVA